MAKALSIHQPFADQIVYARKDCENRTWRTDYRGPLVIHAARTRCRPGCEGIPPERFGALIGTAYLVHCVHVRGLRRFVDEERIVRDWSHLLDAPDASGPWLWLLTGRRPLARGPIRWRGQRGLFYVPDHLFAAPGPVRRLGRPHHP